LCQRRRKGRERRRRGCEDSVRVRERDTQAYEYKTYKEEFGHCVRTCAAGGAVIGTGTEDRRILAVVSGPGMHSGWNWSTCIA